MSVIVSMLLYVKKKELRNSNGVYHALVINKRKIVKQCP